MTILHLSLEKSARWVMTAVLVSMVFAAHESTAAEKIKALWGHPQHISSMGYDVFYVLKDLGINTVKYNWKNKEAAESFLAKAKTQGINVWGLISHGGEFRYDTKAWAEYFARLSLKYPNLTAYSIDDFYPDNPKHPDRYTPDKVKAFVDAGKKINPKLNFWPVLYYDAHYKEGELRFFEDSNPYNPILKDGSMMWLWKSYTGRNPSLAKFQEHIKKAKTLMTPRAYINSVYPHAFGLLAEKGSDADTLHNLSRIFHHPDTLRKMVKMALDGSPNGAGLWTCNIPLWPADTVSLFKRNQFVLKKSDDPAFQHMLSNGGGYTVVGWNQAITANVTLPTYGANVVVSFKEKDNRQIGSLSGFVYKQILVNNRVVWQEDLFADSTATITVNKDVTKNITGKYAKIKIRIVAKKRYGIKTSFYVGNPIIRINGSTVATTWKFEKGIVDAAKWIQVYNIVKEIFEGGVTDIAVRPALQNHVTKHSVHGSRSGSLLRIYDIRGRLLSTQLDGKQCNANGIHFVNMDNKRTTTTKRILGH